MARRVVRADAIKVGDVMAPSLENDVFSVKEVYLSDIPGRRVKEVVIKGPLGIVLKKHTFQHVTLLV